MNRIDDPRIEFYLKHQGLIEEWAAVRRDVRHAAHDFYASLVDDLEQVADGLDGDVDVVFEDPGYPQVGLCRPQWHGEQVPTVAVVFEWQRSSSTFTDGSRMLGVRVAMGEDGGKELTDKVRHALEPIRKTAGFPNANKSYWPAWRLGRAAEGDEYWKDLAPYRQALIDDIMKAWESFHGAIDEVVGTGGIGRDFDGSEG